MHKILQNQFATILQDVSKPAHIKPPAGIILTARRVEQRAVVKGQMLSDSERLDKPAYLQGTRMTRDLPIAACFKLILRRMTI